MAKAFDTHIHLDLLPHPERQLREARTAGIDHWVVPGVSPQGWPEIMRMAETFPGVLAAPGVHPQAADRFSDEDLTTLRQLLASPAVVAIGEVGLDGTLDIPWSVQEEVFVHMIRLARELRKPLLIHTRKSIDRTLTLLERENAAEVGGIVHAFSGSLETAHRIINAGFCLGIGGVITWSNARRLPDVVRQVSAEVLLLETDAPDLTPAPHRGQPNRPVYLTSIAAAVAQLRQQTVAEIITRTTANARRIFQL
ncbi:MAG: TatD family hydrolase [Desulfuromonadales bacterium]|jgi:TatD DNase family protein